MPEIRFYHLERQSLESALPGLLTKAHEKGHRIILKTADTVQTENLNTHLWAFNDKSFLPHGSVKDGNASEQPIWITETDENPNNADVLIRVGGEMPEDKANFTLICDMFDGRNENDLSAARARWKSLKDDGKHTLTYWQQSPQGAWEMKAEEKAA